MLFKLNVLSQYLGSGTCKVHLLVENLRELKLPNFTYSIILRYKKYLSKEAYRDTYTKHITHYP